MSSDHPANSDKRKYYHVACKQTFEEIGDGLVRVTTADGREGIFKSTGQWVEGELTEANLHMLVWTGGPRLPQDFRYRWTEIPIDISRPSGWPEHLERALSK
ncbi:MAG: hypothetical protein JWR50_4411 [Mucilaginibacter sp.]|nr:hypothetical protein [Mucilaginibacter sp.]